MELEELGQLLAQVQAGEITVAEALERLRHWPYKDLGFAKVDHHRPLRKGFPEVILGLGKTPQQVADIFAELASHSRKVLVTKAGEEAFNLIGEKFPQATFNPTARAICYNPSPRPPSSPELPILCAGTADLPVAEEAAVTAEMMEQGVFRLYDVGVAGLHRLLDHLPRLEKARVLVAIAGMEGALPSVLSGLVSAPVIAVPTSAGYGASLGGIAPLLAMLNACSPGVAVVNIDNGFGAGYLAALINSR